MALTIDGITGQFDFWRKAKMPAPLPVTEVTYVVIGCGTSYNLALAVAAAMCAAGHSAIGVPAGEWFDRPEAYLPKSANAKIIALSRSGTTTETVRAAQASRARGLHVTGISCAPKTALEAASDTVIVYDTHPAEGIVMTSSASLMLLAGYALAGLTVDDVLTAQAETLLNALNAADIAPFHTRDHIVFLGGGAHYGVMLEGGLKLMEMAITATQTFHPGEYRHGPISLIDEGSAVVMLYHSDTAAADADLVQEVQAKGAFVVGIGGPGDVSLPVGAIGDLVGAEALPALQLLGERHAQSKNIDTTAPRHLSKVVVLA
ncbi:glucosamine--fructose-6-phosphate aminotransferase (isomerizing) [Octadecabacter temperatus]|uniref:Glutamine--fructose-6-phosphate aminotransferase n=1 Tax=Octadecabacter temperatus TaxID=1458307 RepID=A0A0K0Y7Y6_9RHOB|nr:SIS domain-containing protein [Octadecabacter temperatus]AKS47078.1 Glutamine--fructose-6-phosphate aminotransferase [Octadecabacter temperatus]SIO46750.1 glucosamine--fructose-6-phosphate aminotransferase (isomerizing) [Octadecabacter temperatus]